MTVFAATDGAAVITSAAAGMSTQMLTVAGVAIGIGVIILTITRGYGLLKRFTK